MPLTSFAITPYQLASYRDSLDGLEQRGANFWASFPHPFRIIARTRRFSFGPLRDDLHRRTLPLDDLRDVVIALDDAHGAPERLDEVCSTVARRLPALERAVAALPDAAAVQVGLRQLAKGEAAPATGRQVSDDAARALWPWRWLKNYRRKYDAIEQLAPPLAIDHYLLAWLDQATDPEALAGVLRHTFLVPEVVPAPLPPLFDGTYQEEATYLAPTAPGQPFLTVLVGWDVRGLWELDSLAPLLMGEHELALAIDVQTLPRGRAMRATTNAWNVLREAAHGRYSVKDARAERAFGAVEQVMARLDVESLHQVAYAVLLQAPTLAALDRRAQVVRDELGMRLRLDRVVGAQAEYLRFFQPVASSAITLPYVRRNTLSHGVAVKTPWGIRKTTRTAGTEWGYNPHEGMPIHYDLWGATGVENAHMLMVGKSGSGKTVTLGVLALRQAVAGNQVIMFDPVGKCRHLCDAVGAGAAYYDVETTAAINILDPLATDGGRQLDQVVSKLAILLGRALDEGGRVRFLLRELDNFEIGAVAQALQQPQLYGPQFARLATLTPATAPLLGDLVAALYSVAEELTLEQGRLLAREIELRVLSSRGATYNARTTLRWDFAADVVGYNFRHADPSQLPLLYAHGFEALNRWVRSPARRERGQPLIAIIDEYYYMATVKSLEAHVALATKTWRNERAAMWTADQNSTTYFGQAGHESEWAAFTTNNTLLKFFFRQEGSEAEVLGAAYHDHLHAEDIQRIKTSGKGECIAMLGDEVHHLMVQLTDLESAFFLRDDGGSYA